MQDFRTMFADTRFRRLWIARLVSNLGNGMAPIALSFAVLGLPGANAASLGAVLAAQAVAIVLALPIGGVIADRLPRALLVSTTDLILGAFVVANGALFLTHHATVPIAMGIGIIGGILNALWWPAFPGLVPALLDERSLQRGNGLIGIASNAGMIGGAAVAGGIITLWGAGAAIVLDGVSFLIAGALVFTLRHETPAQPSGESLIRDLHDGWRVFVSYRWLWVIVAVFGIVMAGMRGGFDVGGPVLMKTHFSGAASWAIIQTGQTIGYLTGAVIATRIRPSRPLVLCLVVSVIIPIYLVALAIPAPLPVLVLCAFLLGICFDMWGVLWGTTMQTHIPRESLSRASAFDAMGSLLLGPVGMAVAGPVITAFGLRALFVGAAVLTAVFLVLPLFEPAVRNLRWVDPEA